MPAKLTDNTEAGFSLLEAVIAMAIVALTLSAFYGAVNICIKTTEKARDEEIVLRESDRIIASLGVDYPLTDGVQEINLQPRGRASLKIHAISTRDTPGPILRLFDVELQLQTDQKAQTVSIRTMRLQQTNAR